MSLVVGLALLQNGVLLARIIGMILSERIGLQMPLIRAWTTGSPAPDLKPIALSGVLVGAATGVILVAVEAVFFLRRLPAAMHPFFAVSLWKRLLEVWSTAESRKNC